MGWLLLTCVVVAGIIVIRRPKQRTVREKHRVSAPMRDSSAEHMLFYSINANLHIDYRDVARQETTRRISVTSFSDVKGAGLIKSYCHLRKEARTFRIDRVIAAADMDTGELVEDVRSHLKRRAGISDQESQPAARTWARKPRKQRSAEDYELDLDSTEPAQGGPPQTLRKTLQYKHGDLMRVVLFVAMENRKVSDVKLDMIATYVRRELSDDRVSPTVISRVAAQMGKPSLTSFKASVGRLVNRELVNPVLMAGCCRQIAEEDGVITKDEEDALEFLDRRVMSMSEKKVRKLGENLA